MASNQTEAQRAPEQQLPSISRQCLERAAGLVGDDGMGHLLAYVGAVCYMLQDLHDTGKISRRGRNLYTKAAAAARLAGCGNELMQAVQLVNMATFDIMATRGPESATEAADKIASIAAVMHKNQA